MDSTNEFKTETKLKANKVTYVDRETNEICKGLAISEDNNLRLDNMGIVIVTKADYKYEPKGDGSIKMRKKKSDLTYHGFIN